LQEGHSPFGWDPRDAYLPIGIGWIILILNIFVIALRFCRSASKENQLRLLSATLFACGCVSLVDGPMWPPAQTYVDATVQCSQSSNPARCEHTRKSWKADYDEAIAGGYRAQKHVALCLSTGCDQAIQPDKMLGCAWRMVITESKHVQPNSMDIANFNRFCGADYIDEQQKFAAASQAKAMLRQIGK
jgi:hypothetical protein